MKDAFLSHVDEDRAFAETIAKELESSGCMVWYYERDSLPGLSYLLQTRRAIDEAKCFLFLISPAALKRHHQVDKELVHAHESGKHIIPILNGLNFREFRQARPDWRQAIGSIVGVELSTETIQSSMPRLLGGLRALGIISTIDERADSESDKRATEADSPVEVEDEPVDVTDEEIAVAEDEDFGFDVGEESKPDAVPATIVHEHPQTGFLADLVLTDSESDARGPLTVAFSHQLLKSTPCVIEFQPGLDDNPVQYFRFPDLIHGYPVVLRVHWLTRLPDWSTFNKTFGVISVPAVRVKNDQQGELVNEDAAGMLINGEFKSMILPGHCLPHIKKRRFRTARDSQKRLSVTPAVRRADGRVEQFPKLRVPVPNAPAGVPWLEFSFRIDADGRFTLFARDPLHQMKVRDLIVVQ